MKVHKTTINVVPPYDFFISTHSHRYKKYHSDQYDRSIGTYKKAYEFEGNIVIAEITCIGDVEKPRLSVNLYGRTLNDTATKGVKSQIRKQFLADTGIRPFYKKIASDKVLSKLTKQFYGLKPNWPGDLFECLTRCIISQQINVTFADKVEMNYVQKFGRKLVHNGEYFFVYPNVKMVSEFKKRDLLKIQFSERKAEYLIDLAKDVIQRKVDLHKIESLPADEFKKEIMKIRGVGMWTAECCLMHIGHSGILPRGDIGLHQAIRQFYQLDKSDGIDQVLNVADQWKGWESFATYYLWHALTHERMKRQKA